MRAHALGVGVVMEIRSAVIVPHIAIPVVLIAILYMKVWLIPDVWRLQPVVTSGRRAQSPCRRRSGQGCAVHDVCGTLRAATRLTMICA